MVSIIMKCIHCQSENLVKNGTQSNGKQRLKCKDYGKTFQAEYSSKGAKPDVKLLIIKMNLNGSGIRDTARVLEISENTVISVLKKLKIFLSMSTQNIKKLKLQ